MNILSFILENIEIITFAGIVFFCVVFWFRTSSFFSLFYRGVIFFFGNRGAESSLMNDIVEIEIFNFLYRKDAISLRQKDKFEEWVRNNELDFRLLTKVGRKFDIETLKLRKLSRYKYIKPVSIILLSSIVIMFSLSVLSKVRDDYILFDTETPRFYLDLKKKRAEGFSLFSNDAIWSIDTLICQKNSTINEFNVGELKKYGLDKDTLTEEGFKRICNLLNSNNMLEWKEMSLMQGRMFFTILIIYFIIFLYGLKKINDIYDYEKCRIMLYKKLKAKRVR
jgi:hypothetical protein